MTALTVMMLTLAADPDAAAVARVLEPIIVAKLPNPAVNSKKNWDHQAEFVVGMDVKRRGPFNWVATPETRMLNDGQWLHLTVVVNEPKTKLHLEIKDLKQLPAGGSAFTGILRAESVSLDLKHQSWNRGVRLLSDETRATCAAAVHMECSLTQRLEANAVVLHLDVTKANLYYTNLKVNHALGLDGKAAEKLGEALHHLIGQMKPSVEKDLIAKANAAIVKAADDKEVRIGLAGLLKK